MKAKDNFSKLILNRIPDFGVSTAILHTTDISRRLCKLNFGSLRGHVKLHHFFEGRDASIQHFYFLCKFLGIIGRKRLRQPFWIITSVYYYLLSGIILDLDLDNSSWIRTIPIFTTSNITFVFSHTNYSQPGP